MFHAVSLNNLFLLILLVFLLILLVFLHVYLYFSCLMFAATELRNRQVWKIRLITEIYLEMNVKCLLINTYKLQNTIPYFISFLISKTNMLDEAFSLT